MLVSLFEFHYRQSQTQPIANSPRAQLYQKYEFHKQKKINHLSIFKEIFDDIKNPNLTDKDKIRIQRIDEVLKTEDVSIEELNILIRFLRLIIEINQVFGDED